MHVDPDRWLSDYNRDGYLVVPGLVDSELLTQMREGIEKITSEPEKVEEGLKRFITFEREYGRLKPGVNDLDDETVGNAIKLIMELPYFGQVFSDLILYPPLLDVLETLFGSKEFHFHNYKCIIKAPHVSSKFIWHRDLPYLYHSTPNLLTAMLCLDDMTEENGATVVLPGTHRIPLDEVKPEHADIPEAELPDVERVTVKCPAGSAVIFHVSLIHGGGANRSANPRRNVIGIWGGPDAFPTKASRYAYQGLKPRSQDPARQQQNRMTFPHLFED